MTVFLWVTGVMTWIAFMIGLGNVVAIAMANIDRKAFYISMYLTTTLIWLGLSAFSFVFIAQGY